MVVRAVDAETGSTAGASFTAAVCPVPRGSSSTTLHVTAGRDLHGGRGRLDARIRRRSPSPQVPLERLADAAPSFPTRSEIWLELLEAAGLDGDPRRSSAPTSSGSPSNDAAVLFEAMLERGSDEDH